MLVIGLLVLNLFLVFIWRRRKIYYLASKLDGPLALPIIGNLYQFLGDPTKFLDTLKGIVLPYPNLFKIWVGPFLYLFDSRPEDMEIVLHNCLNKDKFYSFASEGFGDGLMTSRHNIWKRHRKLINPSFNIQVLTSFHKTLVNQANRLMADINVFSGKEKVDLFPKIATCTLNMLCATLYDVDPSDLKRQEKYIENITLYTDTFMQRFYNPFFHISFIWKASNMCKRGLTMIDAAFGFIKEVLALKQTALHKEDKLKNKIFLNNLIKLKEENEITEKEYFDEIQTMMLAGSETTAAALSFVILAIGINPQIQENMINELDSIFAGSTRDPTVDDLNKMDYLERVIKETMRLLPAAPFIAREIDKDITLSDGTMVPSGTSCIIPIFKMNIDPEIWKNPLEFDPDRFLPEEVKTRHPHSFIPFSYGPRNCIGFNYAMSSMKIILSAFLRNYKIVSVDYKSIDKIEQMWAIVSKPKNGCQVCFERRIK